MSYWWRLIPLEERIGLRIQPNGECREWTGGCNGAKKPEQRRPVIRTGIRDTYVSRIVWGLCFGVIPEGQEICHTCDNPKCLRTSHLFLGTHQQNIADMDEKRRRVRVPGERSGTAKLTWNLVDDIRRLASQGIAKRELARRYGVTHVNIRYIVNHRTWKPEYRPGGS